MQQSINLVSNFKVSNMSFPICILIISRISVILRCERAPSRKHNIQLSLANIIRWLTLVPTLCSVHRWRPLFLSCVCEVEEAWRWPRCGRTLFETYYDYRTPECPRKNINIHAGSPRLVSYTLHTPKISSLVIHRETEKSHATGQDAPSKMNGPSCSSGCSM